jgi:hypothetical protein
MLTREVEEGREGGTRSCSSAEREEEQSVLVLVLLLLLLLLPFSPSFSSMVYKTAVRFTS